MLYKDLPKYQKASLLLAAFAQWVAGRELGLPDSVSRGSTCFCLSDIRQKTKELPQHQQQLIRLGGVGQLTNQEISTALGIPQTRVSALKKEAFEALWDKLYPEES